jgi:hypothetical protein
MWMAGQFFTDVALADDSVLGLLGLGTGSCFSALVIFSIFQLESYHQLESGCSFARGGYTILGRELPRLPGARCRFLTSSLRLRGDRA